MSSKSPVLIDDREPTAYRLTLAELFIRDKIEPQSAHLETGDFLWLNDLGERVCVERKTIADFLSSINDGRWGRQIERLKDFDIPIVLLEGNIIYDASGDINYGQAGKYNNRTPNLDGFENILLTVQLQGVRITRCGEGASNVARRIRNLYSYVSREHTTATSGKRSARPIRANITRPSAAFLTGLPGLGTTAANRLLAQYGNVSNVIIGIQEGTVAAIDGIGPKRVKQWQQIIKEHYNA